MKNLTPSFTLMLGGMLLSASLSAQTLIYTENFNNESEPGKWVASVKPTQWNETGEQHGWKYTNCSVTPEQKAVNDGSTGAVQLNHTDASGLEFPVAIPAGIGNVEVTLQFQPASKDFVLGPDGNCNGEVYLQLMKDDVWETVYTVSPKGSDANKAVKYIIPIDDEQATQLRLSYAAEPIGSARIRIYDVSLYTMAMKAPKWAPASDINDAGFTLNWEPSYQADSYEVVVSQRFQENDAELVETGGAENESGKWNTEGNVVRSEEKAASGSYSWKLDGTSALARLWQQIPVEGGTSVNIAMKGWVAANTTADKEMRLWGQFLREDGSVAASAPHISGDENYKLVSSAWIPMSLENLSVPEDAVLMDLDFRVQPGVTAYVDDFTVKGMKVVRQNIPDSPRTTSGTSLQIDGLTAGSDYSVYVYAVSGDRKIKSKEQVITTTGIASGIDGDFSRELTVINTERGILVRDLPAAGAIHIYKVTGQLQGIYTYRGNEIEIPLHPGIYVMKTAKGTYKIIR